MSVRLFLLRERDSIFRAVGEEKEEAKRRKRRKKMEVKSVNRWGRGDGGKRRKGKQERDGFSRAVGKEKKRRKKEEKKKENGGEIGCSMGARRWW